MPFRSWCQHCVKGRARSTAHRNKPEEEKKEGVPRISMVYSFMSSQDQKASKNPMVVMVDEQTGEKYACMCGRKGVEAGEWLIKDMVEELRSW